MESKNEIIQKFAECEEKEKEMKQKYNQTITDMLKVLKSKLTKEEYLEKKR